MQWVPSTVLGTRDADSYIQWGKQTAIHVHKWICTLLLSIKRNRVSEWNLLSRVRLSATPQTPGRILEWVAFSFPRGSSQRRDWTQLSCIAGDSLPAERAGKPRQTTETQTQVGDQTDRAWGSRLWAGPEYQGREETSHPERRLSLPRATRRCWRLQRVGRRCGQGEGNQAPAHLHF